MTPEERRAEFNRLYESIPGSNRDRLMRTAEIIGCPISTIKNYRMITPTNRRTIPAHRLDVLRAGVQS